MFKFPYYSILIFFVCNSYAIDIKTNENRNGLQELINQAINTHPYIQSKRLSIETYGIEKKAAMLRFLPNVSYIKSNTGGGASSIALAGSNFLSVNLPLFTGGANYYGLKKADKNYQISELTLIEAIQDLSFKVISSYSEWIKNNYKYYATLEYIDELNRFDKLIKRRYEEGASSLADTSLTASRIIQANSDLENYDSSRKLSLSNLNLLCSTNYSNEDLSKSVTLPLEINNISTIVNTAIENDPLPKRIAAESELAEYEAKIQQAQNYPQVYATAQRQIGNQDVYNVASQNFYGITIQFNTSQGFSGFLTSQAAYNRAKYTAMNSESALIDFKIKMEGEASEYKVLKSKRSFIIDTIKLQENLLESYKRQYLANKKSWIEVMNSTRDVYNNKVIFADTNAQLTNSSWKIVVRTSSVN